jgi:glycerol-3-phosphate dehydrogenase
VTRDLEALTARTFDVLVVGGGIYGLTIAYDAAQRGLSVALIERADFGSGASFNHLRTIHGGLRYLQTLDLARARESMRERRIIATIAPHAVRPLAFALPLRPSLTRGATAMRGGFLLDRLVAFDRNQGVPPSHHLPAGRIVSGDTLEGLGAVQRPRAKRAAVWYDYVTTEADRLTVSFAIAASRHGAVLANHVEAAALIAQAGRITGVRARDRLAGRDMEVGARITVNATGGRVDDLLRTAGAATGIPMLKAMNLVTRREAGQAAIGGQSASGRHLFLVPSRGRALFGTWESTLPCPPDDTGVSAGDVAAFTRELNEVFPALALTEEDISLVHRGVVPAAIRRGRLVLEGHEQIRDHVSDGPRSLQGLLSVVGAKYTTARGVAEKVTDRLLAKLEKEPVPCKTDTTPLSAPPAGNPTAAPARGERQAGADLPADAVQHLAAAYGPAHSDVMALCRNRPELKAQPSADMPVIGAELVWAVRHEMAMTLADAVVRRTPLGSLGYPGDEVVDRAAAIVAAELGWPRDRIAAEIAQLRAFYEIA